VFGIDPYDSGRVTVGGKAFRRGSVPAAMAAGLALVPEDRQHEGLIPPMPVGQNLSLAVLPSLRRWGLIDGVRERELIDTQVRDLAVKAASASVAAATLSGGNQQKLVLGKWLASRPKALILDEPTRGIDVGAKAQVHRLVRRLAEQGLAVLIISSELPELLAVCDRILVLRQGRLVGEAPGSSATPERILQLALPDAQQAAPT
jgi:rhamnose transport system ATP-binding protein